MVLAGGALALVALLLAVYGVLSILTTPPDRVQHLPRAAWLVLVLVVPLAGGLAWLLAGRPALPSASSPVRARRGAAAPAPDDDAAFLRQLRDRADAQRARARREQARREQDQRDQARRHSPPDEPAAPS